MDCTVHGVTKLWKQLNCISKQIKMAKSEEELNSLLMKMKEESGKAGLKLNIQKTKIIAWAPKSLQMVTAAMKLKDAYSLEEKL